MGIGTKFLATVAIVAAGYFSSHIDDWKNVISEEVSSKIEAAKTAVDTDDFAVETTASNKRLIELPGKLKGTPERIISHIGYTLSFNRVHNQPNWVAWELTKRETQGTVGRSNNFEPDPLVPQPHQVTTDDYKGSGYDRGHMAPAADMKWSGRAMSECFYMSNMCPQNGSLNSGSWGTLEKACRRWAQQEGAVYIVCGPVFKGNRQKKIGRAHKVTVPDGFFKVVLSMKKNHEKAIGFYYANRGGKQPMEETATTVDNIEELTGMDFFVNIPDHLEKKVESEYSLKLWK